ncbi:hypothetical protein JFL47_12400 [Haemophilus haemoglobinophilus]|nr:hypothetical protein [Canicola haemoglobinophilus]MBN6712006.1 hypothetical protein [Canicola haemoglobinophilus]
MFGLFSESKIEKLLKKIESRPQDLFDREFHFLLKGTLATPKDWSKSQKSVLIEGILSYFSGMDGWDYIAEDSWQNIFYFATHNDVLECLKLIAEKCDDVPENIRLRKILKEVRRIQHRQQNPIYDINQMPSVEFQDIGFKLAVIHQLMFEENKLHPKFDVHLFAEEYTKSCIDLEMRGASDEGGEYLRNLDIPLSLLEQVDVIKLSPYSQIYHGICFPSPFSFMFQRYLKGGYVSIQEQAVEDLAFLPNLKKIYLSRKLATEMGLPESFIQALKERNIELVQL